MGLYDRFKRWKRRRGFGVHSPEAYRLVRRVIRPEKGVAYYGEENLDLSDASRRDVRHAKLLLRLCAYLQPSFVWTSPGIPEIFIEAARHAGEVIRIFDGGLFPEEMRKSDLIVIHRSKIDARKLPPLMSPGKAVIAFEISPDFKDKIMAKLTSGIIFEWRDGILALPRADSERYIYHI